MTAMTEASNAVATQMAGPGTADATGTIQFLPPTEATLEAPSTGQLEYDGQTLDLKVIPATDGASGMEISKLLTTLGVITEFVVPQGGQLREITKGADGNLWFTETNGNRIGRMVP